MPKYVMTREDQENFNPVTFTEKLKSAGFRFESERCPVKLAEPWNRTTNADGTVTWEQSEPL